MTTPVVTVTPDTELGDAVDRMADQETSSLVVVDDDGDHVGIVTKTDILESLTWESGRRRGVQINGIDLLDDMTYEGVAEMIDDLAKLYGDMRVLEAKIHLHEHNESLRGVPLLLARIRLYTDKGLFIAEDEGYGASHALHLARNALERQILEGKEYGRSKKHPDDEYWDRLFGWWLSG